MLLVMNLIIPVGVILMDVLRRIILLIVKILMGVGGLAIILMLMFVEEVILKEVVQEYVTMNVVMVDKGK